MSKTYTILGQKKYEDGITLPYLWGEDHPGLARLQPGASQTLAMEFGPQAKQDNKEKAGGTKGKEYCNFLLSPPDRRLSDIIKAYHEYLTGGESHFSHR